MGPGMKVLKIDIDKCNYGRDCGHECEAICASKAFKSDDPAHAALHIRSNEDGGGSVVLCDQCGDCVVVCPADALNRNKQGIVLLSKSCASPVTHA